MKRFLSRLVPLIVPACMVDTPVLESEKSENRLGEGLGAWCGSMCARLHECDSMHYDPVSCVDHCQELFTVAFVGNGASCESSGLRVMDCMDEASCNELTGEDPCNLWTEDGRCRISSGQPYCRSENGASGGASGFCEVSFSDCYDGYEYRLSCEGVDDPAGCQCLVGGEVVGSFPGTYCPDASEAQRICGWPHVTLPVGSPLSLGVECNGSLSSGAGGNAPAGVCDAVIDDCSDGHTYAAICGGVELGCTCEVDGDIVASGVPHSSLCPYLLGTAPSAIAMNYACGFELATSIFIE